MQRTRTLSRIALAASLAVSLVAAPIALAPAGVAITGAKRIQQDAMGLAWTGSWVQQGTSTASGASRAYSTTTGSSVSVTFDGTAIAIIGARGTNWGKMRVYLDGKVRKTIDLYHPHRHDNTVIYRITGLPNGRHTVKVTAPGWRNSRSSSSRISVDAFDIVGTFRNADSVSRVEESDTRLFWDGPWKKTTASWASGAALLSATGGSAEMVAEFDGDAVSLIGPRGPAYGQAQVFLDGKSQGVVCAYSPTGSSKRVLWSKGGLTDGRHTVVVRALGKKCAASKGTSFGIDVVEVAGSLVRGWQRAEDTDPRITHAGAWKQSASTGMSGDDYSYATGTGGVFRMRFTGSSFRIVAPKNTSYGQLEISCDGRTRIVDLYSSSLKRRQRVFTQTGLDSSKTHEVVVRALGTKSSRSRWHTSAIDAFDVRGTIEQAPAVDSFVSLEEDDARVGLSSGWRFASSSSASQGRVAVSTGNAQTASVRFKGSAVRVVAPLTPAGGRARVWLDGDAVAVVDLYSSKSSVRQAVWSCSGLDPDEAHSVVVETLGAANPASSGNATTIDAFHVTGTVLGPERESGFVRVESNDPAVVQTGYWTNLIHTMATGDSYSKSRDARARTIFRFKGTQVAWVGARDRSFGRAYVYLDGRHVATVDNSNYSTQYGRVLWRAVGLSDRTHTVTIRTDDRLGAGSSYWVPVDSFEIVGEPDPITLRADQTDYHVGWTGSWSTTSRSGAYGGSVRKATKAGSSTFAFQGNRVMLFAEKGPAWGKARVSVDGGTPVLVDLYNSKTDPNEKVFEASGLSNGPHTLVVSYASSRNSASSSSAINVDAVAIGGTITGATKAARARDAIVNSAIDQLGKPYVWAADGPNSFDCSGLVMYSYGKAGISLPHYSGSQWGLCSPKDIRQSQLIPGDLVFSSRPSYIHHVGIYIGDGMTINAPSSGRNVEYRDADTYGCYGRIKSSLWP